VRRREPHRPRAGRHLHTANATPDLRAVHNAQAVAPSVELPPHPPAARNRFPGLRRDPAFDLAHGEEGAQPSFRRLGPNFEEENLTFRHPRARQHAQSRT
jgi:hypothetical protein